MVSWMRRTKQHFSKHEFKTQENQIDDGDRREALKFSNFVVVLVREKRWLGWKAVYRWLTKSSLWKSIENEVNVFQYCWNYKAL